MSHVMHIYNVDDNDDEDDGLYVKSPSFLDTFIEDAIGTTNMFGETSSQINYNDDDRYNDGIGDDRDFVST